MYLFGHLAFRIPWTSFTDWHTLYIQPLPGIHPRMVWLYRVCLLQVKPLPGMQPFGSEVAMLALDVEWVRGAMLWSVRPR